MRLETAINSKGQPAVWCDRYDGVVYLDEDGLHMYYVDGLRTVCASPHHDLLIVDLALPTVTLTVEVTHQGVDHVERHWTEAMADWFIRSSRG